MLYFSQNIQQAVGLVMISSHCNIFIVPKLNETENNTGKLEEEDDRRLPRPDRITGRGGRHGRVS